MSLLGTAFARFQDARLRHRIARVARFASPRATEEEVAGWYYRDYRAEVGGWASDLDMELYLLVRAFRPGRVVETGVNRGRSSTAILRALDHNGNGGTLTSIDLPTTDPAGRTNADGRVDRAHVPAGMTGCEIPEYIRRGGRWTLLLGDARELLPRVAPGYDFFFHDSDHSYRHQRFEYGEATRSLAVGGVLASDDVNWTPAWREAVAAVPAMTWTRTTPIRGAAKVRG